MIIPVGFCQVNMRFTGADVPNGAEMTFGLDNQAASLPPDEVGAAVAQAWLTSDMADMMNEQCVLTSVLVKNGPNDIGPSAEHVDNIPGTVSGDSDPPQTAMLVKKETALGGRAGRGRMYQPGVPDAFVNGAGELTGTTAAIATVAYNLFRTTLGGSDLVPVLLHGEGSPITTPTVITAFAVDGRCATQRRRNRR